MFTLLHKPISVTSIIDGGYHQPVSIVALHPLQISPPVYMHHTVRMNLYNEYVRFCLADHIASGYKVQGTDSKYAGFLPNVWHKLPFCCGTPSCLRDT